MDEFLDVVELFVKVLETRVGLLTLRVRLGANKLFFDPLLHLLQQIAVRLDQMVGKKCISHRWLAGASIFQTSMLNTGRQDGCGNLILNECFAWECAGNVCFYNRALVDVGSKWGSSGLATWWQVR